MLGLVLLCCVFFGVGVGFWSNGTTACFVGGEVMTDVGGNGESSGTFEASQLSMGNDGVLSWQACWAAGGTGGSDMSLILLDSNTNTWMGGASLKGYSGTWTEDDRGTLKLLGGSNTTIVVASFSHKRIDMQITIPLPSLQIGIAKQERIDAAVFKSIMAMSTCKKQATARRWIHL